MAKREYESRETNQARNEGSSNSFLLGALIGGIAGAAAALFLAPKTGKELRNAVTNQAGSLMDKTIELRGSVKNKSNELATKTSSLSQGLVQQSSDLLKKVTGRTSSQDETGEEADLTFIPINEPKEKKAIKKTISIGTLDSSEIRKKLEEAQKAFDTEESKVKL
jgi:gas vesicle protein